MFLPRVTITPGPFNQDIQDLYEWDETNGNPIFPNPDKPWSRYVPPSTMEYAIMGRAVGRQFSDGMRSNRQDFRVTCKGNAKHRILSIILMKDFKKLQIVDDGNGVHVRKLDNHLLPFDQRYPLQGLRIRIGDVVKTNGEKSTLIRLEDLKDLVLIGTYWCCGAGCYENTTKITNSPVVRYGPQPNQFLNLSKRFTCKSSNIVYLMHCQQCIDEGNWTSYVGETGLTLPRRMDEHRWSLQDPYLREQYPLNVDFYNHLDGMFFHDAPDPHQLRRDTFTHFEHYHTIWLKITAIDGIFQSERQKKIEEGCRIIEIGRFQYDQATGTGSLNKYY